VSLWASRCFLSPYPKLNSYVLVPRGFRCPNVAIVGSPSISSSFTISAITEDLGYNHNRREYGATVFKGILQIVREREE